MNWSSSYDKPVQVDAPICANEPTNPYDALDQDALLILHKQMQDDLSSLKAKELELRKYIVNRAFPNASEGINKIDLGSGYTLKATVKYNYVLDKDNDKIEACLLKLAKIDNEGSFIADRLINWKATLSISEYRKLEPKYKKIIDDIVTMNDAAPTLTIKEPKAKNK